VRNSLIINGKSLRFPFSNFGGDEILDVVAPDAVVLAVTFALNCDLGAGGGLGDQVDADVLG